jgi:two-component system LytT family response regulator
MRHIATDRESNRRGMLEQDGSNKCLGSVHRRDRGLDENALLAFEVHALDYLLRPLSLERFRAVIERVKRAASVHDRHPVASLATTLRAKPLQRIVVRGEDGAIQVVPVSRLDYIEAAADAMLLVVKIESIEKVEPYAKESRVAILRDGTRLPVSRNGYQRLKKLL